LNEYHKFQEKENEMNAQEFGTKTKAFKIRNRVFLLLIVLVVAGCSSRSSATLGAAITPAPAAPTGHPPAILRVVEREEIMNGWLFLYRDIYFMDPEGDANSVSFEVTSSSLSYPLHVSGGEFDTPAEEQKVESLLTLPWSCDSKVDVVAESRISDRAGNVSDPVILTFSCRLLPLESKPILTQGLIMGSIIAVVLLAGFWLLFRGRPNERLAALRSSLLFFCLLFPLKFVDLILHEGGHGLYELFHGIPVWLFVHPFALDGFSRPASNPGFWPADFLGPAVGISAALLISLAFWKRRSLASLPIVMLFPFVASGSGLYMLSSQGDWRNLIQGAGVPPFVPVVLGAVLCFSGYFLMFTLFPLLGLQPQGRRSLFAIPAAVFLWSLLSMIVAHLFVPGSPYDVEYFIAREVVPNTNWAVLGTILWAIIAVIYTTLFRRVYPKLPAWLRTETVALTWKDLRLPALLAAVSVILGLIIIT
jgi:hypothetical protein